MKKRKKIIYSVISILVLGLFLLTACDTNSGNNKKEYEVTYMVDGVEYSTLTMTPGGDIESPKDPTKKGYTFDGWVLSENGFVEFDEDKFYNEDLTVYAKFSAIKYAITYIDEMNLQNPNPTNYTVESEIELLDLSKDGYVFEGWYNNTAKITSIPKGSTDSISLQSKWVEVNKITYDDMEYAISVDQEIDSSLFNARCYDSNKNSVDVSMIINGVLTPGETTSVTLSTANEDIAPVTIENIKVYDKPEIKSLKSQYLPLREDISEFFVATDSFGEELKIAYKITGGKLEAGSQVGLQITAEDKLGNTATKTYTYTVFRDDIFKVSDTGLITGLYSDGKSLESIIIPNEINGMAIFGIGSNAFFNCNNLKNINIPDNITYIGESAFSSCSSLTSVTIPTTVEVIRAFAFVDCDSLTIFTRFTSKQEGWDKNWTDIASVQFGTTPNSSYSDETFMYILQDKEAFISKLINEQESITIPSQITVKGTTYDVTSIGAYAFTNRNIKSITIPDTITSIKGHAFYCCNSILRLTMPTSVTTIEYEGFYSCDNLTIFSKLTSKPAGWSDSWNWKCPVYIGTTENDSYSDEEYMYIIKNEKVIIAKNFDTKEDVNIPSQVTVRGTNYEVTSIGDYAFATCLKIKNVTIPDTITSIGDYGFYRCFYMTNITIPNSVKSIGEYAFCNCENLTDITIPNDIESIKNDTFAYCIRLTNITLPNSVTSIGAYAFRRCDALVSITIPSNVKSIGYDAFRQCGSLKTITLPTGLTNIGERAFKDCPNLEIYCLLSAQPSGWTTGWNPDECQVHWGEAAPVEE